MRNQEKTDFIERYVAAVGRQLPRRMRADVEGELRSSLQDMLEDRVRTLDRTTDEELAVEILKEMDPPGKMAARYTGTSYLIGPRLYPSFLMATKILLLILVVMHIIGMPLTLSESGSGDALFVLGETLRSLIPSILGASGLLVMIFALLDRVVLKADESGEKGWDPRKLPAVRTPNLVSTARTVTLIVFAAAAMVLINFYPEWIGITYYSKGGWQHISALTSAFSTYLLPLNLLLGLDILLNLVLVRQGQWSPLTRWGKVVLFILGMALLIAMISGPPVTYLSPEEMEPVGGQDFDLVPLLIIILILQIFRFVQFLLRHRLYIQIPLKQ
ncbi:MAG: hypothetical protein AMJ88_16990 [Anaerolineae bacterium SM23_ 63]|nr:MAG: hypothetical protein AMJ88_16990 [Anaerolineae bacterium SM23_ 63]